jgi:GTP-binding protein
LLEFLVSTGRPFLIVGTKSDRLSGNQLHNSMQTLTREFPQARIVPFSAKSAAGHEELWKEIRTAVENHRA